MQQIPVSVFCGYLGSGKTTIILNLIKQLDPSYKVVWLKNEYGDISIDSELAHESNIQVKEMLNGCLCCVLVGKLKNALLEILEQYQPDRIIIETSGTAYPLPIVLEVNSIDKLLLDGVVYVIDALNFKGYKYKDYVAKLQAAYTDLVIVNKTDLVSMDDLEKVLDEVYELNPTTPKVRTGDGMIDKDVLIGLDSRLVDIKDWPLGYDKHEHRHEDEVETVEFIDEHTYDPRKLETLLLPLKSRDFIRIKGVVKTPEGYQLLNWVYGRLQWLTLNKYSGPTKLVFMGTHINNEKTQLSTLLSQSRVDHSSAS